MIERTSGVRPTLSGPSAKGERLPKKYKMRRCRLVFLNTSTRYSGAVQAGESTASELGAYRCCADDGPLTG
jgi:hypothetical protein